MDIYQRIQQLQARIEQLETELAELKAQHDQAQDEAIRRVTQAAMSRIIDAIDQEREQVEQEQAKLPEKRSNGHHPPESEEDVELPIDPDVSSKEEPPSDN